jgi:tetratricopeptide (TPR) repeat protein
MKPTHQAKTFSAARIFTDREDARAVFLKAVQTAQARDEYRVLNWYGIGGQGKSALCNELRETLKRLQEDHSILSVYRVFRWGLVNFEDPTMRQLETATLALRLQLARDGGISFPAFDVAFARYFALINPGVDMRQRHPELFKSDSEILGDLIDWSKEGIEASTTVASIFLPGANILYKYGARLAGRLAEWWERRGKQVLEGLDDLNADQIRQRLPTYLGADLWDHLAASTSDRLVIFLDTYEALWKDRGSNTDYSGLRVDEWVRTLVQDSAGVLFVIFGRDSTHWEEVNPEWNGKVSKHLLGLLADTDSMRFLKSIPIDDDEICNRIVHSSRGLPFYLNLQVDVFEKIVNAGNVPAPDQFGGSHPEILARFIDHLSKEEPQLRLASYPRILDEKIMLSLMNQFLGGTALLDWKSFCSWSFITASSDDRVAMHSLMRDALQANELERRPILFHEVHRYLAKLFDEMAKADQGGSFDVESDTLIIAAAEHLLLAAPKEFPVWFQERWEALWAADRYRVLKRVLEKVLSQESVVRLWEIREHAGLLFELGQVQRRQGNTEDAKTSFERALTLYRSIENSIDKTEIADVLVYLSDVLGFSELDRREALLAEASGILSNSDHASLERRIECETTLGEIARLRGNSDSTRKHYEAALELLRQKAVASDTDNPEPSLERMEWLMLMGRVSAYLEHLEDAERYFETALSYADTLLGPLDLRTVNIARMYSEIIYISAQQDSFETAYEFLEGRLQEVEKSVGETHPIVLQYLDDTALVRDTQARYQDEIAILDKCLDIATKIYGEDSIQVMNYRIRKMAPLMRTGDFDGCIELAKVVDLDRLLKPDTIEKWKGAVVNVAPAYYLTGRSNLALELLNKGIDLFDKLKIKHSDSYVGLLQERAETFAQLGDKERALQDSNQQVVLTRELNQPLPIVLAASYNRHAGILLHFGEYAEAVDYYRQASEIMDRNYDEPTPVLFQILTGLENSLKKLGLDDEALAVEKRRATSK